MDSFWQHEQDQDENHTHSHTQHQDQHNHFHQHQHQPVSPLWNATQLSYQYSPMPMPMPPQQQHHHQHRDHDHAYSPSQHHSPHVSRLSTARVPFQPLPTNTHPTPSSTLSTAAPVALPRARDGRWDLRRQQALSLAGASAAIQTGPRPVNQSSSAFEQISQNSTSPYQMFSPCAFRQPDQQPQQQQQQHSYHHDYSYDYEQSYAQQFPQHQHQQQREWSHHSPTQIQTHYQHVPTQHTFTHEYQPSQGTTPSIKLQQPLAETPVSTSERPLPETSPSTLQRLRKFAYQKPAQNPPQDERPASSTPKVAVAPVPKRPLNTKQIGILDSKTQNDDVPPSSPTESTPPQPDGIQLVPISAIPAQYKTMFHFPVFNAVQSTCFDAVFRTDDNVVISAPTGAGKTVLFELAIIRMLQQSDTSKAVYMAPTKSLCTQKASEWKEKLQAFPCSVVELTGDSDFAGVAAAKAARVIVTTPEKWDAMTRNWSLNRRLLDSLSLMLIDEVHTLREKARGPRFEIVVSRMHAFGNNVRFIAVSATVPNVVDIAEWLGKRKALVKAGEVPLCNTSHSASPSHDRARVFEFGEEFRPCPLTKIVYGYQGPPDQWSFQTTLNSKLLQVVSEHASDKPTLIFVPTRKATTQAAQALQQSYHRYIDDKKSSRQPPWTVPPNAACAQYHDIKLRELSTLGIAFHHAGLDLDDRKLVEEKFLKGSIRVLCCTSTLAVGVNLPAYCVIIRGTKRYEGQWAEVSDLDLLQMLGRAGRPQFDRSGVAVIMTEQSRKEHYESMVSGCTTIESRLHEELVEHINSEIGLRSDCTVADLEKWLGSTFLAVRSRKNPSFYEDLSNMQQGISTEERLRRICSEALERLNTHDLISRGPRGLLNSTEYGETLSTYMLSLQTMLNLLTIDRASLKDLIGILSGASEFSDIRMRAGEKAAFNKLRTHSEIRFPPDKVSGVPEKVSLLLQSVLAGLPLRTLLQTNDTVINPLGDTITIFRHCPRIVKAMTDIALHRQDAVSAKNAFELLRSVNGRSWDASSTTLTQLEGIGEKSVKVLASAGFFTYQQVATADPFHLEMLLKKNPPFGFRLVEEAASLPHFTVDLARCSVASSGKVSTRGGGGGMGGATTTTSGASSTEISVDIKVQLKQPSTQGGKQVRAATKSKRGHSLHVAILTLTSDGQHLFDFRRLPMKFLIKNKTAAFTLRCRLTKSGQKIVVHAGVDEIAGSGVRKELDPGMDAGLFGITEIEEIRKGRDDVHREGYRQEDDHRESLEDEWNELRDCQNLFDDCSDGFDLADQDDMQAIAPTTFYGSQKGTVASPRISNFTWSPPIRRRREDDEDEDDDHRRSRSRSGSACVPRKKRQTEQPEASGNSLPAEPVLLKNGNYRCNHTCKDRKRCRHICCREGLLKPPKVVRPANSKTSQRKKTKAGSDCSEEDELLARDHDHDLEQDLLLEDYDLPSSPPSSSFSEAYVVDASHRRSIQMSTSSSSRPHKKLTGKRLQAENKALLQRMESLAQKARCSTESHGKGFDRDAEEDTKDSVHVSTRQPRQPLRLTLPPKTSSAKMTTATSSLHKSQLRSSSPHPPTKEDLRREKYNASFQVPVVPTQLPGGSGSTTSGGGFGSSSSSPPPAEFERMLAGSRRADTQLHDPTLCRDLPPSSASSSSLDMTLYAQDPQQRALCLSPVHTQPQTQAQHQETDLNQGEYEFALADAFDFEEQDDEDEDEQHWRDFGAALARDPCLDQRQPPVQDEGHEEQEEEQGEQEPWWDFVEWENLSSDAGVGNVSVQ